MINSIHLNPWTVLNSLTKTMGFDRPSLAQELGPCLSLLLLRPSHFLHDQHGTVHHGRQRLAFEDLRQGLAAGLLKGQGTPGYGRKKRPVDVSIWVTCVLSVKSYLQLILISRVSTYQHIAHARPSTRNINLSLRKRNEVTKCFDGGFRAWSHRKMARFISLASSELPILDGASSTIIHIMS